MVDCDAIAAHIGGVKRVAFLSDDSIASFGDDRLISAWKLC